MFLKKIIKKALFYFLLFLGIGYGLLCLLDYTLPLDMARYQSTSTIISDYKGRWLRIFLNKEDKYRIKTDYRELPKDYLHLLINYEDRGFYRHHGIDALAVIRALKQNIENGAVISGASTISMQTARLLMPQPRTFKGKIIQAFRAYQLEKHFSKTEILDIYATLVPVGGNREGLAAASYYYLNKPIDKLSLGESAWLVALTQSPKKLSHDKVAAIIARNKVLKRALDYGVIEQERYLQAVAEPLIIEENKFPFLAPHFSQYTQRKTNQLKGEVITTIDKGLQQGLEELLWQQLHKQHKQANLAGGILDNQTGNWLAYAGTADFFSRERKGQIDMLAAIRSPGSTLKPFITLYAFDWLNYTPETTVDDTPILAPYHPANYDGRYQGRISLAQALSLSRNVPAVRLLKVIQPQYFAESLKENGVQLFFPNKGQANLALALGGVGIRGDQLAKLYSLLANCSFLGYSLAEKEKSCQEVTYILQRSQDEQGRIFFGKEPVAFKTGTAYGWKDRWVFAYTKKYTIVLWNGRADNQFTENRASAEALVPILRQVIKLLPSPPKHSTSFNIQPIRNHHLPLRIRHINENNYYDSLNIQQTLNNLKLKAPLHNSIIDHRKNLKINLEVEGGSPPFIYLLNGRIIDQTPNTFTQLVSPEIGSYHIVVVDSTGESVEGNFRLIKKNPISSNRTAQWQ